jgi:hypothetical protein
MMLIIPLIVHWFVHIHHISYSHATNVENAGYSLTVENLRIERKFPPLEGTVNWKLLQKSREMFSPRHSHATCVFRCPHNPTRKCLWLTGGATQPYRTWNLNMEDRASDVWYSEDGSNWFKVKNITGDFLDGVGNFDAKIGSDVAPWYSRFGHSLDTLDVDGDGNDDFMVLMGGYEPTVSNDVWISPNGTVWNFVGYAPWPERAYHATFKMNGDVYIAGGTPLSNDVWKGRFAPDETSRSGYNMTWTQEVKDGDAAWAPRCAMCIISQIRKESIMTDSNETTVMEKNRLYLIGGYASWPREDPRWNGARTRNDVWTSIDGKSWSLVLPPEGKTTMPFVGRGWHSCITLHDEHDLTRGIRQAPHDTSSNELPAKMIIAGGAYTGEKNNNVVYDLEGYTDMFWSIDGSSWTKINYEEGMDESLWSSNEWSQVLIGDKVLHRGKWGHTMELLSTNDDLNMNGLIDDGAVSIELCTGTGSIPGRCVDFQVDERNVRSLFIIGGDTTGDGGPYVNDVFISQPGIMCEQNGETCSSLGKCGFGNVGCICKSEEFIGEYCEKIDETFTSNSFKVAPLSVALYGMVLILLITL